jgi:Protein of unknown function (DUF1687)
MKSHPVIQKQMARLEVSTSPPTRAQLDTITGYLGGGYNANKIVEGASSLSNAEEILKTDETKLKVPFVVDWDNGKVAMSQETVEHLLEEIRKSA